MPSMFMIIYLQNVIKFFTDNIFSLVKFEPLWYLVLAVIVFGLAFSVVKYLMKGKY